MNTYPFTPTHKITLTGFGAERGTSADDEVIEVCLCDDGDGAGPAYTFTEWSRESAADFERDADGNWTFQGESFNGSVEKLALDNG